MSTSIGGSEASTSKVKILYRAPTRISDEALVDVARQRRILHRSKAAAHGVVSRVYRLTDASHADSTGSHASDNELCIKRVVEEDQVAPHSVHREIAAYEAIENAASKEAHTMHLLAAFQDDSDPFSVTIDLVMPYIPCTLQELLNEPGTFVELLEGSASRDLQSREVSSDRPAATVVEHVKHVGPAKFALKLCKDVVAALVFLHSKCGVAHRDIKPSNIVVDAKGRGRARLIDFGTCQFLGPTGQARDPRGDDGRGGLASEVGSGAYRAPECLLSPRNGYDACAVDVWQAGATLVEFFTPLQQVTVARRTKERDRAEDSEDDAGLSAGLLRSLDGPSGTSGGPLDWEKALWADDDGEAWSRLREQDIQDHAPALHDEADFDDREASHFETAETSGQQGTSRERTVSGWKRSTLFDGARGDLGLASSIFALRGLPEADDSDGRGGSSLWPEATDMQPPLAKLPFMRQPADPAGLRGRLEKLQREASDDDVKSASDSLDTAHEIISVLDACLQLSAGKRVTAERALEMLEAIQRK